MIVVGGGAIALSTAQELCSLQVTASWCFGGGIPILPAQWKPSARSSSPRRERIAARDSNAPVYATQLRSLPYRQTTKSICTLHCWRATPTRESGSYCGNSTGPSAIKSKQNLPNCSVLSLAWHS